jgi:hypothetical protein
LPGSQGIYTDFDHFFYRESSNAETSEYDFSNFNVTLTPAAVAPEPTSAALLAIPLFGIASRRRKRS